MNTNAMEAKDIMTSKDTSPTNGGTMGSADTNADKKSERAESNTYIVKEAMDTTTNADTSSVDDESNLKAMGGLVPQPIMSKARCSSSHRSASYYKRPS